MSEQHIPIFIGSTYEGFQEYRRKVQEALGRLETYVKGMEQFGAASQRPLEKCLAEVGKSKIYVGIFAMRYGSLPDGYTKSFTHLEYEKAQDLGLPSLIFIINEETPIPPKYVDMGENAKKLKSLKAELQKNHTCDFFTTPEDLACKVATSVANELNKMKTTFDIKIESGFQEAIQQESTLDAERILKRFKILPKRWRGVEFIAEFCNSSNMCQINYPKELLWEYCDALNLPRGHTIKVRWELYVNPSVTVSIYVANELADQIIDIDKISIIKAKVETDCLYIVDTISENILRLKEIIEITDIKDTGTIPF